MKSKKMKKTARTTVSLEKKILEIMNIPLENIIPDARPLLAALLFSSPDECLRIRHDHPNDSLVDILINSVYAFRKDAVLRDLYIADGFFNEQLEYILHIAKKDRSSGARLMPIFCSALSNADDFKIPGDLQKKIITHINWQRKKDGFAILELSRDKTCVVPADDVIPS